MLAFAFDRAPILERSVDQDGRLRVSAASISKAAVNPYLGMEIPGFETLGLEPDRIYFVLRDPQELRRSAPTFNGIPLLSEHAPISAAAHPHELVVGALGTDVCFDDPYLLATVTVWDQRAIDAIESASRRELSCAYRYTPEITEGTFEGEHFDITMRTIVGNHCSLVNRGRSGEDCAI